MAPKKQLTPRKCAVIVQCSLDGKSIREISTKLGLAKSTVYDCVSRYKATGSGECKKRKGRPRVSSMRHDIRMRRYVLAHPFSTSNQVKDAVDYPASTRTIRRRLVDEFNLKSHHAAKKPLLKPFQLKKRLQFCKTYAHWTEQQWKKVMFSDECTFQQFGLGSLRVRRFPNTRFSPQNTLPTVKHSPKVMVWGCFSAAGRGNLAFIPAGKTVNAQMYRSILEERLERTMLMHRCTIFQQDSAPCHTAGTVKNWLKEKRIRLLNWPGNSPDLNPIENLWQVLKRKVRLHAPSNLQDLYYWIKRVWVKEVSEDVCHKLVTSMPRRIQAVKICKGQMSKY